MGWSGGAGWQAAADSDRMPRLERNTPPPLMNALTSGAVVLSGVPLGGQGWLGALQPVVWPWQPAFPNTHPFPNEHFMDREEFSDALGGAGALGSVQICKSPGQEFCVQSDDAWGKDTAALGDHCTCRISVVDALLSCPMPSDDMQ